ESKTQEQSENNKNKEKDEKKDEKSKDAFDKDKKIIDEIYVMIFELLEVPEMHKMFQVCRRWHSIILDYNIFERNEIACFFTKQRLSHPDVILGVGFERIEDKKNGRMQFKSQMDFMSLNAWMNDGVRTGVWGETLTHFLPLVINKEHGARISDIIETYLKKLWLNSVNEGKWKKEESMIECIATIMNSMVVEFVFEQTEGSSNSNIATTNSISLQLCEKALLGYVSLYHLLLWLVYRNPGMKQLANKKVGAFIKDPNCRLKGHVSDLGVFLIYILISDFTWNDVGRELILESLSRNALWITKRFNQLNTCSRIVDRLERSLDATTVSRRLIMFQVWFMTHVNEPCEDVAVGGIAGESKDNFLRQLNSFHRRLGRPTLQLKQQLRQTCDYILHDGSRGWNQYFILKKSMQQKIRENEIGAKYAVTATSHGIDGQDIVAVDSKKKQNKKQNKKRSHKDIQFIYFLNFILYVFIRER
ncbi:hypothetical protein RFI_10560, partial [Reticulomyxa filosa]